MRSPLKKYHGGKSRLVAKIVPLIPPHVCYCEPLVGGGWVLFGKPPSKVEVINDYDCELVTFWRVIQHHLEEFLRFYKYSIISRKIFDLEKLRSPATLTDIQRAVRYYYLQRLAFGGLTDKRHFGTGATRPPTLVLSGMEDTLLDIHWRLQAVVIENLDGCECIRRYDRPTTFFYIDPPYYGVKGYAARFKPCDFIRLRASLAGLKGKFILSLNDVPEIRRLFKGFKQQRVSTIYSSTNGRVSPEMRSQPRGELLIRNF